MDIIMKKFLIYATAIIATLFVFISCDDDYSTSNWLNYTVWKADLLQCSDFEWDEAEARIWFKPNGYRFILNANKDGGDGHGSSVLAMKSEYRKELDYAFPIIEIPYFEKDDEGNQVEYIWKGTFSEDRKELHIEKFTGSFAEDYFKDIVFKR